MLEHEAGDWTDALHDALELPPTHACTVAWVEPALGIALGLTCPDHEDGPDVELRFDTAIATIDLVPGASVSMTGQQSGCGGGHVEIRDEDGLVLAAVDGARAPQGLEVVASDDSPCTLLRTTDNCVDYRVAPAHVTWEGQTHGPVTVGEIIDVGTYAFELQHAVWADWHASGDHCVGDCGGSTTAYLFVRAGG